MAEAPDTSSELASDETPEMDHEGEIPDIESLTRKHTACLRRGDLLESLRHAITIVKTARQTQAPIPREIMETVGLLRKIRWKTGEFDMLFSKLAGFLSPEIRAERQKIAARVNQAIADAPPANKDYLEAMSTADLIRFVITLERENKGRTVNSGRILAVQQAIVAKNPRDIEARIYLVRAMLNAGALNEAARKLEEIDEEIVKDGLQLTASMLATLETCRKRIGTNGKSTAVPAQYENYREAHLLHCTLADLRRYSKQAWTRGDWEKVLYFTDKIHERPGGPSIQNCIAHAHALTRLGRLAEALNYNMDVIGPLVENNPDERKRNDRIAESLRRRLNIMPADYREADDFILRASARIGEILRWSREAEQDGAWDRVAAFRKRLIELEPNNPPGYIVLGTALEHLGRIAEALKITREKLLPLLQNPELIAKTKMRIAKWERSLAEKENV